MAWNEHFQRQSLWRTKLRRYRREPTTVGKLVPLVTFPLYKRLCSSLQFLIRAPIEKKVKVSIYKMRWKKFTTMEKIASEMELIKMWKRYFVLSAESLFSLSKSMRETQFSQKKKFPCVSQVRWAIFRHFVYLLYLHASNPLCLMH